METIYAIDFDNTITKLNKKRIDTFISGDSEALLKYVRTVTKYLPGHYVFISSYSSEEEKKAKEKKIQKLFPSVGYILIPVGVSKAIFAKPGLVLIDDYDKNLDEWQAAGGTAWKYINKMNSIRDDMTCVCFQDTQDYFYVMDVQLGYPIQTYRKDVK